ncbi:hypothetical protein Rs2_44292 [Raphanus sativus]|nr:hypothetical protein Rs2_44292 [Raphanus sativus]
MGQVQQDDRVDLTNYSQQTLSNCMILGDLTNIRNSCLKDARSQRMSILRKKRNSIETENSEGVSQNREQAESFVSSTQNNSSYLPNPISFTNLLQSMGSPHQEDMPITSEVMPLSQLKRGNMTIMLVVCRLWTLWIRIREGNNYNDYFIVVHR